MRIPKSPPNGPIKAQLANELLTEFLGIDPAEDPAVGLWTVLRGKILKIAKAAKANPGSNVWLAKHGAVNPRVWKAVPAGKPVPIYLRPGATAGRPPETAMDRANAFLLQQHPKLKQAPLYFAMLEALFRLDRHEAIRFPGPDLWEANEDNAMDRRRTVRDRARHRIALAMKHIGTYGPNEILVF